MYNAADAVYRDLVVKILSEGHSKPNRTGVETLSLFGPQLCFNLEVGFPILTLKRTHFRSIAHEFVWMVCRGDTNTRYLTGNGVTIWDEWASPEGELGPIYGHQFRAWERPEMACSVCSGEGKVTGYDGNGSDIGEICKICRGTGHRIIDQVQEVITSLRQTPDSRRHIINLWNVAALSEMALPPCHTLIQFDVTDGKLSCHMYQRSADMALGVPFNIAFYALFVHVLAQQVGLSVGRLIISFGDAHLYKNHLEGIREMLTRDSFDAPRLEIIRRRNSIDEYTADDFKLLNYRSHPVIKLSVAA